MVNDTPQVMRITEDDLDTILQNDTPFATIVEQYASWAPLSSILHDDTTPVVYGTDTVDMSSMANVSSWSLEPENKFIRA